MAYNKENNQLIESNSELTYMRISRQLYISYTIPHMVQELSRYIKDIKETQIKLLNMVTKI